MAELVDALDLGSSGLAPWEFDSPLSHHFLMPASPNLYNSPWADLFILVNMMFLASFIAVFSSVRDNHS